LSRGCVTDAALRRSVRRRFLPIKRQDGKAGSQSASLPVGPGSSIGHRPFRIMRMTSKPLIVAAAVGNELRAAWSTTSSVTKQSASSRAPSFRSR